MHEPFIKSPFAKDYKPLHTWGSQSAHAKKPGVMSTMNMTNELEISSKEIQTGKKIRPIRGVILSAVRETSDTWTLTIFVGEQAKEYLAGQFISISPYQFPEILDFTRFCEYKKGKKEPVRAYSLTSAPHEKHIAITIKPEVYEPHPESYPPLLSPLLASDILVGREIEFLGYSGGYVVPHDLIEQTDTLVHVVAGSGIVPSFSVLKDELINNKHPHTKHHVLYVNRKHDDIIFHEQLKALEKSYAHRLHITYFLTQDETRGLGPNYVMGRPSLEHVQRLSGSVDRTIYFACGPALTKWQKKHAQEAGTPLKPRFMEWVHDVMESLGVDKKRFKREVYG